MTEHSPTQRLMKFVTEWNKLRNTGETIYGLATDVEGNIAELTCDDIKAACNSHDELVSLIQELNAAICDEEVFLLPKYAKLSRRVNAVLKQLEGR